MPAEDSKYSPEVFAWNEYVARQAVLYARQFIREGYTQLANNEYSDEKKKALFHAVQDVRHIQDSIFTESRLEHDACVKEFYNKVAFAKKYSLGNCEELAFVALDYVIDNAPLGINAEVYGLSGGDHALLVIGRTENSDPNNPDTWGENAFIADPWANQIYPASRYKEWTKNYYATGNIETRTNWIEDFSPQQHKFTPYENINVHYMRKAHTPEHFQEFTQLFKTKCETLLKCSQQFQQKLEDVAKELRNKYGDNHFKLPVLYKKIEQLKQLNEKIEQSIEQEIKPGKNYYETRHDLELTLNRYNKMLLTIKDSRASQEILRRPDEQKSVAGKVMDLYKKTFQDVRDSCKAMEEIDKSVDKSMDEMASLRYTKP
ncbi:hypothetical protein [Legionella micdadei]|uniref:Uncharacterized protein n=1 Tax=Legionella micdadei TaxID=451 RepID=A0A098GJT4_LEGMI|nr:hypothetical protein [Legionella micdadei]ARG98659.1 hypothetical protein B6N58_13885 [Legionella micdadei]ARH01372.1 hypothetical protein B6V88_13740 [Legionella micdadei]KTD28867.1 hypothetical protein Lmic_0787 [Legionella micdadei]NSL17079.1 hypothetical protein [Legionella micdadei]CEG62247.1 protein of unknown function [Legionella micdadei]